MNSLKTIAATLAAASLLACLTVAPAAQAAPPPVPAWSIQSLAAPTNFAPGDESGKANYQVFATNSGGKATDHSPVTITDTLPAGLEVKEVSWYVPRRRNLNLGGTASNDFGQGCEVTTAAQVSTVECKVTDALVPAVEPSRFEPGDQVVLVVFVAIPLDASGTLVNEVEVEGGGAEAASLEAENQASAEDAPAGFEEFKAEMTGVDGKPAAAAGAHPFQYTTSFAVNMTPPTPGEFGRGAVAGGDLKEIEVKLPPGLVGNPTALPRCGVQDFIAIHNVPSADQEVRVNDCPDASAVGLVAVQQKEGGGEREVVPLYNLISPKGMPAQLGFQVFGAPIYVNTRLRSDGDYGITAYLHNVTQAQRVSASRVTVWGNPADPAHDTMRGRCAQVQMGTCPANLDPVRPFLRAPTSCDSPLLTGFSIETWARPAASASAEWSQAAPGECELPDFSPSIVATPTTDVADSPSGLHVVVHSPQAANEDSDGLGEADLKDATVTLPPGLVVNPASADGLGACPLEQIGYEGIQEGKPAFSAEPATCPDASKIGTVRIHTPLLEEPLPGSVYLARQGENPFGSLLAIYIAVDDPISGVVVKLAGKVTPDPTTGQLTTTVTQSPQVPFEDFELDFFSGARAPLRTPATCGTHTTTTSLVPWSAPAGAGAAPSDSFAIARSPGGGGCPSTAANEPHAPRFEAGTADPVAGSYSPFLLRLSREDGSQELSGLNVTLPAGLIGKLAGVAECSEGQIAAAKSREVPGGGAAEKAAPSCPESSRVGTVVVGAGAGPAPFHVQGNAYLAGPYKGAPLSMAIVTPAVAGPFDLGAVVVRVALQVDPESARITAVSDPIPSALAGIPLDVRSIALKVDRPNFILNPTSCEAKAITGAAISVLGQSAPLENRFQVGNCEELKFAPKLSLRLKGGTKRSGHPALSATLTYPQQGAYSNIAKAQVALPHSEFLDQGHIGTVCTRVQFAADSCPARSIYGYAKATTPLLDAPLEGPVYLRSSNNPLPDLVVDLNGRLEVVLVGRVDTVRGGIRNSFEAVPDAPVSKFTLNLFGGKKGLLVNSTDICRRVHRATATFTAQNGKVSEYRPPLKAKCPKGQGKKKHKRRG